MPRYTVSCASPPAALDLKPGQTVGVQGWKNNDNITAEYIVTITEKGEPGQTYLCGLPQRIRLGEGENVKTAGRISNLQHLGTGVQFDLDTR